MKSNRIIKTFNEHVNQKEKHWFKNKSTWDKTRNTLNVVDDDLDTSRGEDGKLIAFWYEDRGEGWVKLDINKPKGEYYADSLEGEEFDGVEFGSDDYGVFHTEKGGHCFYYGSKEQAEEYADKMNE